MSIFDKFLDIMELNDDDDYDDDFYIDDDFYEDDYEERPRRSFFNKKTNSKDSYDDFDMQQESSRVPAPSSNVTPMRQPSSRRSGGNNAGMEVCVVKPISVDDSREITETLLSGRTVILNLERSE